MFHMATRPFISDHAIKHVRKHLYLGGSLLPGKRGGSRRKVRLEELARLHDYVDKHVPREISHYCLGMGHNSDQVILEAHWCPSKIYWEYMKLYDNDYYLQQQLIRQLKGRQRKLPDDVVVLRPVISLTSARKYLKRLCFRVGKDHKDRCATCYKHELHIKLGKDVRANKRVKKAAVKHALRKRRHLERGWRAYETCAQERELCLKQNREQRSTDHVPCTCGLEVGLCKCRYNTREGFAHLQLDKGSKLGLPQFHVNVLWYKSRMWVLVEHVTDTSQEGRGRRTAHMWQEITGAGGSANMISVLWHHLRHNPSGRKGLTLWLDNCWHELKNWDLVFFLHWLVLVEGMFEWAEVKYYESGHSYMGGYGPDCTHSKITNAGKLVDRKVVAEDWYKIARECNHGEITVVEFEAKYHRDWRAFLSQWFLVQTAGQGKGKIDSAGQPVCLPDYRYLRVEGGKYAGFLQAWEEDDPTTDRVLIRCLKFNFPKNSKGNPLLRCYQLKPPPVRLNGVKGAMAGFEFMGASHKATWRKVLVGVAVAGDLRQGKQGVALFTERTKVEKKEKMTVLTEARFNELLRRVTNDETEEESSDDPRPGGEKRRKLRKKALAKARKQRRAAASKESRALSKLANPLDVAAPSPLKKSGRPRKNPPLDTADTAAVKRSRGRPPKKKK